MNNKTTFLLLVIGIFLTHIPSNLNAQDFNLQETLGLERYDIKFGLGRGFTKSYSTFSEGEFWSYQRISDTTQVVTHGFAKYENVRDFRRMNGAFFEISRNFKPMRNDLQLNVGLRHSRQIFYYRGYNDRVEVYSQEIDTISVDPPNPMPNMVDGMECDTTLRAFFEPPSTDPRVSIVNIALTTRLSKPFFNQKLFVFAGADFLYSYYQNHSFLEEGFIISRHPTIEGQVCSTTYFRNDLAELSRLKLVGQAGIQYMPHPRFGIELAVRKHVFNIFPNDYQFTRRPAFIQFGGIVRLQDDFLAKKKLELIGKS